MEVSVLIPTYKNPNTLARAIDSVLNQKNFDSYEIIVIDDNNPNDEFRLRTEKVMIKYNNNKKVVYIKHKKNKNGAAARNTGFKVSKGRYICLLDDDDIFLPNKLALQVQYMNEHPEYGASYTWRCQSFGEEVRYTKKGNLEKDILLLDFFPTTITLMIKRECYEKLGGFDEKFRRHQDFEFLLRFFEQYEIGVVEKVLSQVIGKSTSGNQLLGEDFEKLKIQFLTTFDKTINRIDSERSGFKKKVYANHYSDVFAAHISSKHFGLALRLLIKGFILYGNMYFIKRIFKHYKHAIERRKNKM